MKYNCTDFSALESLHTLRINHGVTVTEPKYIRQPLSSFGPEIPKFMTVADGVLDGVFDWLFEDLSWRA